MWTLLVDPSALVALKHWCRGSSRQGPPYLLSHAVGHPQIHAEPGPRCPGSQKALLREGGRGLPAVPTGSSWEAEQREGSLSPSRAAELRPNPVPSARSPSTGPLCTVPCRVVSCRPSLSVLVISLRWIFLAILPLSQLIKNLEGNDIVGEKLVKV